MLVQVVLQCVTSDKLPIYEHTLKDFVHAITRERAWVQRILLQDSILALIYEEHSTSGDHLRVRTAPFNMFTPPTSRHSWWRTVNLSESSSHLSSL